MSLSEIISQAIDEDLKTHTEEEAKKTAGVQNENESQLQELQKKYNETIQAQVNETVHLKTYSVKRDHTFQKTEDIARVITQAYQNALPKILETSFFKSELERFLKRVSSDTTLSVSGTHAAELKSAVEGMNYSCSQAEGAGLGTIRYKTEQTDAEFTLEDVLEQAQFKTIDTVMKLVGSHD